MPLRVSGRRKPRGGSNSGTLYDVLELILGRGLVIDAFVRVSLVGIEILKIDVRVVVASVDTYLRFAEACNRLDLESGRKAPSQLTDLVGEATESGAKGTRGMTPSPRTTPPDGRQPHRQHPGVSPAGPRSL